jgi:hypothetical protein
MDIQTLSELLYGSELSFGERPRSRTNEHDFPPRIFSLKTGNFLADLDKDHQHFHIVFYADRCEVWPVAEWKNSISIRGTYIGVALKDLEERNKHYSLFDAVKKRLGIRDLNTIASVTAGIEEGKITETHQIAQLFRLTDIIKAYHERTT